jgi:hypothetical protein
MEAPAFHPAVYWLAKATPTRTRIRTADDDRPIMSASFVEEEPALSFKSAKTVFM